MITRRRFLQGVALGGVAVAVAPLARIAPVAPAGPVPLPPVGPIPFVPRVVAQWPSRRFLTHAWLTPDPTASMDDVSVGTLSLRRGGEEKLLLKLATSRSTAVQWVALRPDEGFWIEPGDEIVTTGGMSWWTGPWCET